MQKESRIFVVDLDGTFIKNDLFIELLIMNLVKSFREVVSIFFSRGIVGLKQFVFVNHEFSENQVLINHNVLEIVREKKALGYCIILATASPQVYADFVANTWNIFDKAYGSTDLINLKGSDKLKLILSISGGKTFEYIGDSRVDNIIFKHCSTFYKVIQKEVYEFTN